MVEFNRNLTKKLIKASNKIDTNMSKCRFDWLTENKNSVCGCIYDKLFSKRITFVVAFHQNEYKLLCSYDESLAIYLIEDIEDFLKFIKITELISTTKENIHQSVEELKILPATGLVNIQDDKIFLYDFVRRKH